MATAHDAWVAAGRLWRDARPIAQTKDQLRVAYPRTLVGRSVYPTQVSGGIQTNDAHLLATIPEDHTPYPAHPWPYSLPPKPAGYIVCAIDYMHGVGGLDCDRLFGALIGLCRSGNRPWTKYINWRGKRYDVRNGWAPVDVSGHFDHIHESVRSDWIDKSIDAYPNPFVEGGGMAGEFADQALRVLDGRNALGEIYLRLALGDTADFKCDWALIHLRDKLVALDAKLTALGAADEARDAATHAAIVALADRLAAGGGGVVDVAPILAAIDTASQRVADRVLSELRDAAQSYATSLIEGARE